MLASYADLIQPLANIEQVQILTAEPTTGYVEIATTPEYKFYFQAQ